MSDAIRSLFWEEGFQQGYARGREHALDECKAVFGLVAMAEAIRARYWREPKGTRRRWHCSLCKDREVVGFNDDPCPRCT